MNGLLKKRAVVCSSAGNKVPAPQKMEEQMKEKGWLHNADAG